MILSLVPKSNLPNLMDILTYKFWLWDQNCRFGRAICVLGQKSVILTIYTKKCLAERVCEIKIKPNVDHYGIGHRQFSRKERFKIGTFFIPKFINFWSNFKVEKNWLPSIALDPRWFQWPILVKNCKISWIQRIIFVYFAEIRFYSFLPWNPWNLK